MDDLIAAYSTGTVISVFLYNSNRGAKVPYMEPIFIIFPPL
jgi:hypothetical protein